MNKIFTLFTAAVMTMAANAQSTTENFGSANNSEKDTEVVCPGFTIAGDYVAGGSSKVNVYNGDKGMKLRANKTENTLILTVDENTTITAVKMGVVTNDAEQSLPIIDVLIDGESTALSYPIATFNTGNAEGTAVLDLTGIAATETIGIKFDDAEYTAKNKQVFIAGEVTYTVGGEAEAETSAICAYPGQAGDVEVDGVMGDRNYLEWENGLNLTLERSDKSYSSAKDIKVGDAMYTTIKLSNGAMNTLRAPEGYVINKLVVYSYINYNRVDKGSEGRTCYWKQIGDLTYTEEDATILKDYTDVEGYQETPDKVEVALPGLAEVQLQNTGEQLCFVLEVGYAPKTSAIANIAAERPAMEDGVMYNLQGVRVDDNYRGIVIMNGKKVIKH